MRKVAEVYVKILVFLVFLDFEMMENLDNPENLILYSENIPIDFQGETILQRISTDFLRMSVNVSVERPWRSMNYEW